MFASGENRATWIQPEQEDILDRFEEAWAEDPPADLFAFIATQAARARLPCELLEELVKIDLEYRWRTYGKHASLARSPAPQHESGSFDFPQTPRLEDYLRRLPDLSPTLDLIAEEYRVRCRWDERPHPSEYVRRFPRFTAQLPGRFRRVERELRSESTCSQSAGGTHHEHNRPAEHESVSLNYGPVTSDMPTLYDASQASPPSSQASNTSEEESSSRSDERPLPSKIGRYEVRSLLGEGAFGVVYLAYDPQLKRRVAIKTPHRRRLRNRRAFHQFLEEAQLAAQLQHPVLVAIYDIQASADDCYLVMEYVEGKSLANFLIDDWPQRRDWRYAAQLIADIAGAVHEAHKKGLVHRDLKPANILIDTAGRPHVTDFGLALREEDQRRRAWEISGTPAYMAPEQVRGESHRLDGRCDIWSLGAILYELLTCRRAFDGRQVHDVFDEIVHREPKPPRQIDDTIPAELERICLRCLAKDISARYTTARDLCDDLLQFLDTSWVEVGGAGSMAISRTAALLGGASISASTHHSSLAASSSHLPQPTSTLIGRQRELAEIRRALLDDKTPIITLLGPGGVGKTRLAQQVAHGLAQPLPGGCWWADLSAATTAAGVANAVLAAFGASVSEGEAATDRVASLLHYRPRLVLVLDNFEQVVDHAQATVGLWRLRAPHAQFLVTSREPLGLSGERQYELEPLAAPDPHAIPESLADAAQFPSIELFVRRAQEADAHFTFDESNVADVARVCAQLEGLPLAVELAAARIKILKPAQMLKKFDQKLKFLKSARRDLSDRQRTLEGAIQWSYDHLEPWERHAFLQVSAFTNGFYLEAAEAVIDLSPFPDAPLAIDVVQSLREQCLLRTLDERYELRLGMYQSIREFGEQKRLATFSPDEEQALQERLAEYLIDYCETWSRAIHTRQGLEALDRITLETENLFAVQDWAAAHHRPDLTARAILALAETLAIRGPADQRLPRLEAAFQRASTDRRAALLVHLSSACHASGDWDLATWYADQAVAEAQQELDAAKTPGDSATERQRVLSRALRQQGLMRRLRGDMEGAIAAFTQSEANAREADDRHGIAAAMAQRGFVVWQLGQFDEALSCYRRAEALAREIGDRADLAAIARQRGHLHAQRGEYAEALADLEQTEKLAKELGDRRLLQLALSARGTIFSELGKYDEALECYEKAERHARQLGEKRGIAVNRGNRGLVYADRGEYEKALACYADAEALNRELGVTAGIALNIANRGVALAGLGRYDDALTCLLEAEHLHQQLGNRVQEAINRGERGTVLLAQKQTAEALACLSEALRTFDELEASHTPDGFNFLTALALAQKQAGDHKQAEATARRALDLANSLAFTADHPRLRIRANLELLQRLTDSE